MQAEDLNLQNSQTSLNSIILGDFNAHNPLWDIADKEDQHGLLSDWTTNQNLVVLNNNQPTRIDTYRNSMSAIDITLCTCDLAESTEWEVAEEPWGNDNLPILTIIGNVYTNANTNNTSSPKFNLSKANWPLFQNLCTQIKSEDITDSDADQFATNFINANNNDGNKSIPKTKPQLYQKKASPCGLPK